VSAAPATLDEPEPPNLALDDAPPFHLSRAPEEQSLLDVALAEVERHGGDDRLWEWTPRDAPAARGVLPVADDVTASQPAGTESESEEDLEDLTLEAAEEPVPAAPPVTLSTAWPTVIVPAIPSSLDTVIRRFSGWFEALLRRAGPSAAPSTAAPGSPPDAAPPGREVALPPPPLRDLPIVPFAPTAEEAPLTRAVQAPAAAGRRWELRALVATGLAGAALVAFCTRSMWMPAAGTRTTSGSAARPLPPAPARLPEPSPLPREVQAAIEQLPHLAPETIQLVMSGSERGLPGPPEVFRRAHWAAHRGASVLTEEEAAELRTLKNAVLAALRRIDRDRVRAYDRMSPVRDLLVAEDGRVLTLFSRGVHALAPPRRERLQALLGKAIAAELSPRPPVPPAGS
jgi:hypothetical protein